MDISPLLLARIQFAVSLVFHVLFPAIAFALAWMLLFFKIRGRVTGNPGWQGAYRFWVRIFALSFIVALASALPLLFQLGSLWPVLMERIGNVAGPLLGYAVVSVFVLKSCFLGVMLFGQRRVSDTAHTLSVLMVALGMALTGFWVLALESWSQTPTGADLVDGRYRVHDWLAVIFNPSLGWTLLMTLFGSVATAAFLVLGITAWQALRRPLAEGEKLAFKTALVAAAVVAVLQIPAGMGTGRMVAEYQPAKAAAAAGYWQSGAAPDAVLIGWPDLDSASNLGAVSIAGAGAPWLGRAADGSFLGLDKFSGMHPPVPLVFWSLRIMIVVALLMGLAAWPTLAALMRKGFDPQALPRWWLRILVGMTFSGWVLVAAGWLLAEGGRQPYVVYGAVTLSEVFGATQGAGSLAAGLAGYGALYAVVMVAFLGMLFHAARHGVVAVRKKESVQ